MKRSIFAAAVVAVATGLSAQGALLISNVATSDLGGGVTQWSYTVAVQPDSDMRVVATVPPAGSLVNDAFTLFDFVGYVPGSATLSGVLAGSTFTLSEQLIGLTPALVTPTDSVVLPNFSVALTGGANVVAVAAGPAITLFTLNLQSSAGGIVPGGITHFTGQTLNKATTFTQSNVGLVQAPIPEPAGLGLLVAGLPLLARRRRA